MYRDQRFKLTVQDLEETDIGGKFMYRDQRFKFGFKGKTVLLGLIHIHKVDSSSPVLFCCLRAKFKGSFTLNVCFCDPIATTVFNDTIRLLLQLSMNRKFAKANAIAKCERTFKFCAQATKERS